MLQLPLTTFYKKGIGRDDIHTVITSGGAKLGKEQNYKELVQELCFVRAERSGVYIVYFQRKGLIMLSLKINHRGIF